MVAFDSVGPSSSGVGSATSPLTWTHTASGSGVAIFVFVEVDGPTSYVAPTVTIDGSAMTSLGHVANAGAAGTVVEAWWINNQASGAHTISFTYSGGGLIDLAGGSIGLTGVGSVGTLATNSGTSITASVAVGSSTSGNLIVGAGAAGDNIASDAQTQRFLNNFEGTAGGVLGNIDGSTAAAGGAVTLSWGLTSATDTWAALAVEAQAPGAGPPPPPPPVPLPVLPPGWFPGADRVTTQPGGIPFCQKPAPADATPAVIFGPTPEAAPLLGQPLAPGWFPGADADVAQSAASVVSTSGSTATLFASGTPTTAQSGTGSWTNPAQSSGTNDGLFATFTSTTANETGTINPTGFGAQAAIGSQPTSVDSVAVTVFSWEAQTARWTSVTAQLFDGSTPLGSSQSLTLSSTTTNSQTITFTGVATWANLANLTVRVIATKAVATSSTFNLDAVGVVVNFTNTAYTFSGGGQPGVALPGGIPFYAQPQPTDATPAVPVPPPPPPWPVPMLGPLWFPGSDKLAAEPGDIPFWVQPQPDSSPALTGAPAGPYITGASADGTYFTDQYGNPRLLVGEDVWDMVCQAGLWNNGNWQLAMSTYLNQRAAQGFNASEISCFTSPDPGPPNRTDGADWDGVWPFLTTNDPSSGFNNAFWTRRDYFINAAAAVGITPVINLTTTTAGKTGCLNANWTTQQWTDFGTGVGARYKNFPNILWIVGDDYFGNLDTQLTAMLAAMRAAGDNHLVSIQNYQETTSRTDLFDGSTRTWGTTNAQFSWVYTYNVSYVGIETAKAETPAIPAVWGDGTYTSDGLPGGNHQPQMQRNLTWWALSSGAAGFSIGNGAVWPWASSSPAAVTVDPNSNFMTAEVGAIATLFSGLTGWQHLQPDTKSLLVTGGRGSKTPPIVSGGGGTAYTGTTDAYVTASRTPDGSLAVIYMSHATTITIDQSKLGNGYTATWVDPATGATSAGVPGPTFNSGSKGTNSAGDADWTLVLQGPPVLFAVPLPAAPLPPGWFPGADRLTTQPGGIPFWQAPQPTDQNAVQAAVVTAAALVPSAIRSLLRQPPRRRPNAVSPPAAGVSQPPIPPASVRDVRREPRVPPRSSIAAWTQGISQPPIPPQAVRDTRRPWWRRSAAATPPPSQVAAAPAPFAPGARQSRLRPVRFPRGYAGSPPSPGFTPGAAAGPPLPPPPRRITAALFPRRGSARGWSAGISQPPVPPQAVRDTRRPPRLPPRGSAMTGGGGISQPPVPPQAIRDVRREPRIPPRGSATTALPAAVVVPSGPYAVPAGQARRRPARFPSHAAVSPPSPGFTPGAAARSPQPIGRRFRPPFLPHWQRTATPVPPQAAAVQAAAVPQVPRPLRHLVTRRAVAITPAAGGVSQPPLPPVIARPVRRVLPRRGQAASWTQGLSQPPLPPQPPVLAAPHRVRAFTRWQRVTQHVPPQVVIPPPPPALPPAGARRWPLRTRRAVTAFPVPPQVIIPPAVPAPRAPRRPWTFRLPWWMRRSVIIFPNVPPPAVRKATAVSKVTEAATTPTATGEQATTTTRVTNPDQGSSSVT